MQAIRHQNIVRGGRRAPPVCAQPARLQMPRALASCTPALPQVTFYGCVLDGPKGVLIMEASAGPGAGSARESARAMLLQASPSANPLPHLHMHGVLPAAV